MTLNLGDAEAVDLFAGPGGWDVAAVRLGLKVIGIEFDSVACQTRRAADLATIEGDVRHYHPALFPNARILIASPPCQTFSLAGNGAGRKSLDAVLRAIDVMSRGELHTETFTDERTALVLEPLRWALEALADGRPFEVLAFEQVPTVLPVWEAMAVVLRAVGYSVVTGFVYAEQHGVPQTRKRAILIGLLRGEAKLPTPTHSRYHSRTPDRLDEGVSKWVSMAEALGWGAGLVGFPRRTDGRGDVVEIGGVAYRGRDLRSTDEPSFVVTEKARSWSYRASNAAHAAVRRVDHPAPTVLFGHAGNDVRWYPEGETTPGVAEVATTRSPNAVQVTPEEAAALQSFPEGYPWKGTRTKTFEQIGNAVPPLMAEAVLRAALRL